MKYFTPTKLALIVGLYILIVSCSKKSDTKPQLPAPSIVSLNVNSGPFNTDVIITGTGFDATIANDKVFFNGKAATVVAATNTQIITTVPLGAGTGKVTVAINNGPLVSGPTFSYQPSWVVSTFAGSGMAGNLDGVGESASFNNPAGIAIDNSGNIYVADQGNIAIRKITPNGTVTTIATLNQLATGSIYSQQSLFRPYGIAVDNSGNVYLSEGGDCTIKKINQQGIVTLVAGKESGGWSDATGQAAGFLVPFGLSLDSSGNLYVADKYNYTIRKITSAAVVSTVAGTHERAVYLDGTGTSAIFDRPNDVAVDALGNIYVTDSGNHLIRKINTAGMVTTLAGDGSGGYTNGDGRVASFNSLQGLVVDKDGSLYIADLNVIRKIDASGTVSTFAGQPDSYGSIDGPASKATFFNCQGITIDSSGNLYVTEAGNNLVRKISLQ